MAIGQRPADWAELGLKAMVFLIRATIILLALFTAAVVAYLGVFFVYRLGSYVFETFLRTPWATVVCAMTVMPRPSFPPCSPARAGILPERVTEQVERAEMPSGRVVEIKHLVTTQQDGLGRFVTRDDVVPLAVACGDIVLGLEQLAECSRCFSVVCLEHRTTCLGCGLVVCTACSVPAGEGEGRICKDCARQAAKRARIRGLLGLFWRSNDETA
jgi:hypothetical protein